MKRGRDDSWKRAGMEREGGDGEEEGACVEAGCRPAEEEEEEKEEPAPGLTGGGKRGWRQRRPQPGRREQSREGRPGPALPAAPWAAPTPSSTSGRP